MQNYNNSLWLHVAKFRVTEEASVAETAVWPITFLVDMFTALKGSVLFSFAVTAAGVVQCGGPKKSPHTSSIVQIIFSFWSFEISEGILRNQKNYYRFRFIF